MKISKNKKQFQIIFDSNNQVNNIIDREQQKDIIDKFVQPCIHFQFPYIYNQQIQKFKKKVIGSANQYGTKNQKTTSIFLSLLEVSRQIATNELKKKQYLNSCSYYAMCLGFIDPEDELFLEKFIITKIDIVNKLMFCIFELNELRYLDWSLSFLQDFLDKAKDYAFQSNLVKSDVCMIQLNYYYLARIYKKKKNYQKAILTFSKAQQIIALKQKLNIYEKNPSLDSFSKNLEIKILYKISKCYRDEQKKQSKEQLLIYEGRALHQAEQYNPALYQYISKKIRMYKSGRKFKQMMTKLQGKKKIQEEVLRHIQQSSQKQFSSLYDVYKDRPPNYSNY